MKVALCLSGHIRSLYSTIASLKKHVLSNYEVDVFIATYYQIDSKTLSLIDKKLINELNPKDVCYLNNTIMPQSTIVQKKSLDQARNTNNVLSMFNQIKIANDLKNKYEKEHQFIYDVVIRARPDISYKENLQLVVDDKIHLPKYGHFAGYNDQLAFGSSKKMNVYAEVFDKIDDILLMNLTYVNPELILKRWLCFKEIEIELFDCSYAIVRNNGEELDNKNRPFTKDGIVELMRQRKH